VSAERKTLDLAARQHGVVTTGQALASGMTERMVEGRLRSRRWRSPERALYIVQGSPDTREQRLIIALLGTSPHAVLSHTTAGAMFGLVPHPETVHGTIPHGDHLEAAGRVVHQARDLDQTTLGAWRVTTPNRTLLDVAAMLPPGKLEGVLDEALMRRLANLERLLAYIEGKPNKGVRVLRRLLIDRRDGVPQEEMEREFKRLVRRFKLPKPKLQHPFADIRRIDAAYPDLKIAIELDGWRYHGSLTAFRADRPRQSILELEGWMVLRFTWDALKYRAAEVAATIATALERRAKVLALPTRACRSRGSG
jgi:very-short-patch-repair endonuclease